MSEAECEDVVAAGVKAPVYVAPPGIDTREFADRGDFASLIERHPELAERQLITFVGRLTAAKRLDLLLDAFALAASRIAGLHLVIAGPDDEGMGADLRRRARKLRVEHQVSFLGFVDGPLKVGLLCRSLAFVLPSEAENFGIAAVEAMAAETPVVVARGVGIQQRVADAQAGLVVASDAEELASALVQLASDARLAARLGANARRLVESSFSRSASVRKLEQTYLDAANGRAGVAVERNAQTEIRPNA
jgi:glycosyltransferase involved in cell wall biosynthesis